MNSITEMAESGAVAQTAPHRLSGQAWRKRVRLIALMLVAAAANSVPAQADTLVGEVVGVADGDTVTVLDVDHHQHKVRLAGIDAPEKKQPFGNRSRQALAQMVFRRQVTVEWHKKDRYLRLVGLVRVGSEDVGLAQVRAGFAWHYKAYQREQSGSDQAAYAAAEDEARSAHLGLWSETSPQPPWDFRAGKRGRPERVHEAPLDQSRLGRFRL